MIIFDFWFIIFSIIFIIGGIFASEIENFIVGTATFLLGLASLQWLFHVPVWQSIIANPVSVLFYLVLYVILGTIYTLIWRWPEYIRDNSKHINELHARFNKHYPDSSIQYFFESTYNEYSASNCKEEIATWIITWPFSLLWELARKPIKYISRAIYSMVSNLFDHVGRTVTSKVLGK